MECIDSYFESKVEFEIEYVSIIKWVCCMPVVTYNSFWYNFVCC